MPTALTHPSEVAPLPDPGSFALVPDRCIAEFSVRHLLMATARGRLYPIDGRLVIDDDPSASWCRVDFDASSVSTGSAELDRMLQGSRWLSSEAFGVVRFESTGVEIAGPNRFSVRGDLYVRDLVGDLTLDAWVVSSCEDRVRFGARADLSRRALGLVWPEGTDSLAASVADRVRLTLAAEFAR